MKNATLEELEQAKRDRLGKHTSAVNKKKNFLHPIPHTDTHSQTSWLGKGGTLFSHRTNRCAQVAVLFLIPSKHTEIIYLVKYCGYALEKFLLLLSEALSNCPQERMIALGCDFNCTLSQES